MLGRVSVVAGTVVGLVGLQMTNVHAASELQPKKKVRPSELPIYGEPEPPQLECVPELETAFHKKVSEARKWTWRYLDSIQDTTNRAKDKYDVAKAHSSDLLTYIQEDSGVLPRIAIITVSGLGGVVAGYKGGVIRKSLFAATAMTAAASVCYPRQAVAVGKEGWKLSSDFATTVYHDLVDSSGKKTSSTSSKTTSEAKKPETEKETKSTSSPEMDFGMSKPEDKDMYTTRGS